MLRTALFALIWMSACLLLSPDRADGQPAPTNQAATQPEFECQHPANPHRRQHGCNDAVFGLDEALAGDWTGVRREMQRIGITPTASYVSALQTNVAGGQHQVWSYSGQLSLALSADFNEILKVPGLSAYVGTSWGTGSNLGGSLNSMIPTSNLYAPSFYLGEMYLQQKLLHEKLTIFAGRLAARVPLPHFPFSQTT